ncbi:MAG: hypothetical protein PSV24_01710 [Rhodoferax sp.]|nr:hypothetical protein [Rhodoferax sp.]
MSLELPRYWALLMGVPGSNAVQALRASQRQQRRRRVDGNFFGSRRPLKSVI